MSSELKEEFQNLLQGFVNDELDVEAWQRFDQILSEHKWARDEYRDALDVESALESKFKLKSDNVEALPQVKADSSRQRSKVWVIAVAMLLFAILPYTISRFQIPSKGSQLPAYLERESFAVITEMKSVTRDLSDRQLYLHRVVGREKIAFQSGQLRLEYFNGAIVELEGPCEFYVQGEDKAYLNKGQLSAKVTEDSIDFKVFSPGASLVDLGTEFALSVTEDRQTQFKVFEGEAEISLLNENGETIRSQNLFSDESLVLNPQNQSMERVSQGFDFKKVKSRSLKELPFKQQVLSMVAEDAPIYAWDFSREHSQWKSTHNSKQALLEMPKSKGVTESSWVSEGKLDLFNKVSYSIEFWFNAEKIQQGSLLSILKLKDKNAPPYWKDTKEQHLVYIEVCSKAKDAMHSGAKLRFLHREPSGRQGGVNLFSKGTYIPGIWHHVVAMREKDQIRLYFDGELQGEIQVNMTDEEGDYLLYLGALDPLRAHMRQFRGGIESLNLYAKPLSAKEVKEHYLAKFKSS